MPLPPEFVDFLDRFEALFQRFMRGEMSVRPMNEDIERVYRHLPRHNPAHCRHGKTRLTCSECYFDGFTERGNAI